MKSNNKIKNIGEWRSIGIKFDKENALSYGILTDKSLQKQHLYVDRNIWGDLTVGVRTVVI